MNSTIASAVDVDVRDDLDSVYRKAALRIIPLCLLAYVISFIDRSNIGMAKLQFMEDLKFSEAVYGLGAGLFFIGYMVLEIPINLLIERRGARVTFAAIMVIWGAVSSALAVVSTPMEFYLLRFALGVAEAGLFPGIVLYLSYWFPKTQRGKMIALFAMGGPIAGIIGSPLGGWLMTSFAGFGGFRGWQNLFIFEGLPAVLLGIFTFFYLDDRPGKVSWLSPRENEALVSAVRAEADGDKHAHTGFGAALKDRRVYVGMITWISVIAAVTVVTLWTPTFLSQRSGASLKEIGLLAAVPSLCAAVSMFVVARHSDAAQERRWHFFLSLGASAVSLLLLVWLPGSLWSTLALLSVASAGSWAATPVFWTVPSSYLRGDAAAAGIALISSSGALGGFFAPTVIGWVVTNTGSYAIGITATAVFILAAALLFLLGIPSSGNRKAIGES
jgi:D-galactonate transporter